MAVMRVKKRNGDATTDTSALDYYRVEQEAYCTLAVNNLCLHIKLLAILMASVSLFVLLFVLALSAVTLYARSINEPNVVPVVVKEGSDVILPCSPSTNEDLVAKVFDWKKDDQKEVFFYDAGIHYNNGREGQDQQFKGRVFHFPEQLEFGNASIIIHNTTVTDSGTYACIFPRLKPQPQTFKIKLIVDIPFRDRAITNPGAALEPYTKIVNATEDEAFLMCNVQGAFPQPKVEWQDSDGNVLPAEQPQVTFRDNHYYVTPITTVTQTTTNCFYCVVTQDDIRHRTTAEIYIPFIEKKSTYPCLWTFIGGWFSGVLTSTATVTPLAVFLSIKHIKKRQNEGASQQEMSAQPLREENV